MSHTPGPWHVTTNQLGSFIYDSKGKLIGDARGSIKRAPEEQEANAHLIAAAPTMYDLLSRIVHCNDKSKLEKLLEEAKELFLSGVLRGVGDDGASGK